MRHWWLIFLDMQCSQVSLGDARMMSASLFTLLPMCRIFGLLWAGMAPSSAFHLYMRLKVFGQHPYLVTGQFSNQPPAAAYHHKNPWQVYVPFFQFRFGCQGTQLEDTLWNCNELRRIQCTAPWVMSNVGSMLFTVMQWFFLMTCWTLPVANIVTTVWACPVK